MEYRAIRSGDPDPYFEHALFGNSGRQKGAQNKNHKYLARAWWQNKWRYAYTQAEVKALQNLGKAKTAVSNATDKAKTTASNAAAKVTKTVDKAKTTAKNVADSARNSAAGRYVTNATEARKAEKERDAATESGNRQAAIDAENRLERAETQRNRAANDVKTSVSNAASSAKSAASSAADKGKAAAEKLLNKASSAAKSASEKVTETAKNTSSKISDAAERVADKASSAAKSAADKVANSEAGQKVSDAAERVADKVSDVKTNAEHKVYAAEMKRKYGADSLHYQDAQALLEHDKAADELAKARKTYGTDSSEYKAAMKKEQAAKDKMDEVHEQNLYANNAQYKKASDRADYLGSYIDQWDANGGPKTAEGKANYRKMQQELNQLENKLERLWNEDWE